MARLQKIEGQVEVKCSADKIFKAALGMQQEMPKLCPNLMPKVEAPQRDWSVGSIKKWDCVIDGKTLTLTEKIEAVDENNKIIERSILDGEIMKTHYRTMIHKVQFLPKGDDNCVVKSTLVYEKLDEVVPDPHRLLQFTLDGTLEIASHLINTASAMIFLQMRANPT